MMSGSSRRSKKKVKPNWTRRPVSQVRAYSHKPSFTQQDQNDSICCSPSDSTGKRVGPPPDPTPLKRIRVEPALAPNAAPQAVRPPLFLPQVLLPGPQRLFLQPVAAPYVPQLPNLPPLNYNVPNGNFDFNMPMHYGPPHRFFRPLWTDWYWELHLDWNVWWARL